VTAGVRQIVLFGVLATLLGLTASPAAAQPARARTAGEAVQLIVDGRPFLILGGELANSSASGRAYMAPVWPRLRAMGLNSVVAPVSWELIEPAEGRWDFTSVDALIEDARANDMHLVLLWFGAWKNSMSSYAPAWVKRDTARFPRVRGPDGAAMEMLSAFDPHALAADVRAFAALMAHLRAMDGARHTVLMVQVENEVGMIPSAREHGPEADAAFAGPVPRALTDWLAAHRATLAPSLRALWEANGARRAGSWREVFGEGDAAEEIFTAWSFARYVEAVAAAAGKAQYRLPMYVNAALARPGRRAGEYPSGGRSLICPTSGGRGRLRSTCSRPISISPISARSPLLMRRSIPSSFPRPSVSAIRAFRPTRGLPWAATMRSASAPSRSTACRAWRRSGSAPPTD
jgi:beta-galactosidase GanA